MRLLEKLGADSTESRVFPKIYGARNRDPQILQNSTSGGIFSAFTKVIIENGGYVCGAVFDNEYRVIHTVANNIEQCRKMCGAKYVQSELGGALDEIVRLMANGRTVLFVGTPCQVAGVKNIAELKKLSDKLITVDIICHGVPSPGIFREHIQAIEKSYGKVLSYSFRDKKKGWRGQNVTIRTESGIVPDDDAKVFTKLYFNSLIIRPSCFSCQFASVDRSGDITIGDFWGIEGENPEYDDNKGISEILINTDKGLGLFHAIGGDVEYFEVKSTSYIQPNMKSPTEQSVVAGDFWKQYKKHGFACTKKFLRSLRQRILCRKVIRKIKYLIEKGFSSVIAPLWR